MEVQQLMPAKRKAPDERGATRAGQDPQFLSRSVAISKRHGIAIPEPSPRWCPQARSWYNSLKLSGQSDLFEASDWATAVAAAEALHVFYRTRNASILGQWVRLSERLGVTVVDRKRNRIELVDSGAMDQDEDAADAAVLAWHKRIKGAS
jgi:hypothetical protein